MNANSTGHEVAAYNDTYTIYELKEPATDSSVLVCPERGGIVIGCRLRGRELLYLDRATFLDPEANIRGGIPVLFPICGQLRGGQYEWEGRTYSMRNHGVARTSPWEVVHTRTDGEASLTIALQSNAETLKSFPFEFELHFTYRLKEGKLHLEQSYNNLSDREMPVQAGFHPYFATDDKHLSYASDATRMLDYNDREVKPFEGSVDLNGLPESVALLDPKTPEIVFALDEDRRVKLTYSEAFKVVVLWAVEGKPFVCVEPWTALNEALNDKEGLILVPPGDALEADLAIELV
ncbi:aldose epimerase [Cohnella sp. REN36]|uniref:aldose epimerase family protein n=1 Tax=Cohnella sp. REN36 TaxID=2887347 RepID=UPI001D14E0EB|nr:aldose epimerase [Cohnella sp. REN36]MCC3374704.1 aldose epimerase [Cohnella sp. REN36]